MVPNSFRFAFYTALLVAAPWRPAAAQVVTTPPAAAGANVASPRAAVSQPSLLPVTIVSVKRKQTVVLGKALDIELRAGALVPGGPLYQNTKTTVIYGGGLGKEFALARHASLRTTVGYRFAQLPPRSADRLGHLSVHAITLRVDHLFGPWRARPFVGGAIGAYPWRAGISQKSSGQRHHKSSVDVGGQVVAGVDVRLGHSIFLAPELSWTRIAGSFSDMLWGAELAARWRL